MPSTDFKEPERLARRPRYGPFPVPYVTYVDQDGRPDFKVHLEDNRRRCGSRKLCQLCGTRLDPEICFVGVEDSVRRRIFGEPPMHRDCLEFAWSVCPWLAGGEWRIKGATIQQPADHSRLGIHTTDGFDVVPDEERPQGEGIKYLAWCAIRPVEWRDR